MYAARTRLELSSTSLSFASARATTRGCVSCSHDRPTQIIIRLAQHALLFLQCPEFGHTLALRLCLVAALHRGDVLKMRPRRREALPQLLDRTRLTVRLRPATRTDIQRVRSNERSTHPRPALAPDLARVATSLGELLL